MLSAPDGYKITHAPVFSRAGLVRAQGLDEADAMQRIGLWLLVGRLDDGAVVVVR